MPDCVYWSFLAQVRGDTENLGDRVVLKWLFQWTSKKLILENYFFNFGQAQQENKNSE